MKLAVISGAASGVGLATLKRAIAEDFIVLAIDRDRVAITQNITNANERYTGHVLELDLRDRDAGKAIEEYLENNFASLDEIVVFSAAGRADPREFGRDLCVDLGVFRDSVENNLTTQFTLIQAVLPIMRRIECKKSIVLVSSINAIQATHLPSYSAAKSALRGLAVALSRPLQSEVNASINVCLLGTINPDTDSKAEPKDMAVLDASTFRGKILGSGEAAAFLFWMSQAPLEFTGQELIFDAGQSLGLPIYS